MLESSRGDDLKDPAQPVTGVPEGVPLLAGFEDEIPLLRIHDLISELRPHAPFKDVAVLVLVRVPVKRGDERPRGDRMLHKGEPTPGLLDPHHKPDTEGPEVESFPVVGPDDARTLRGLEAMRGRVEAAIPRGLVFRCRHGPISFPYTSLCKERWQSPEPLSRLGAHFCVIISPMPRKYEMKRRAERVQETRQRIAEAAVELHETVGPARTTVSAIAEKAGVQRHTYYAHFPELKDLYRACMGHRLASNPLPEPSSWADVADAEERLRVALSEVYAYFSGEEAMLSNVLRDTPLDPVGQEVMVPFYRYWETVRDTIAAAFEASGERHEVLHAALALALNFQTWRTLVRQQELSQDRAVWLMVGMVRCLMRS